MTSAPAPAQAEDRHLDLHLWKELYAVCRLSPSEPVPAWAVDPGGFSSVTRTAGELSLVCLESNVPEGVRSEKGWRIFEILGPLEFDLTGILLAVARPLYEAGVGIFVMSTYDTDHVMVKSGQVEKAVSVLTAAGHRVHRR